MPEQSPVDELASEQAYLQNARRELARMREKTLSARASGGDRVSGLDVARNGTVFALAAPAVGGAGLVRWASGTAPARPTWWQRLTGGLKRTSNAIGTAIAEDVEDETAIGF